MIDGEAHAVLIEVLETLSGARLRLQAALFSGSPSDEEERELINRIGAIREHEAALREVDTIDGLECQLQRTLLMLG